jgi:uncharacterized protein YjiK
MSYKLIEFSMTLSDIPEITAKIVGRKKELSGLTFLTHTEYLFTDQNGKVYFEIVTTDDLGGKCHPHPITDHSTINLCPGKLLGDIEN